ncbi:MAG: glycosyltransferase family 4 protein [Deltaproteobacteria bacterium]|nr:glycosyltransferase family 4 protein [Deltaproteobacteria bacterium]
MYIICLILGGAGAWVIGKYAPELGLVDLPNERSSHAMPTPKGGGIGILAAFVFASLFLEVSLYFWLPATFLALFSLLGDKVELSPKFRLPVQFVAALIVVAPGLFSNSFIKFCPLSPLFCLLPLSIFIVGTANFYNFMDGINGIAGITGVVGFGLIAFYAFLSGIDSFFVTLAVCMSLSCLGFLPFNNIPKAKVFMGDVGSILLGFAFAGMVVWLSKSFLDFVCLAAFLFPFYMDELTTMIIRLKDGENLTRPHRRHLYQFLANEMGIAHRKISAGYGVVQLIVGLIVLLLKPFGLVAVLFFLTACFAGFVLLNFSIRKNIENWPQIHT